MIEFEVLKREYPRLVDFATAYAAVDQHEIEKLAFAGPVLLKILDNMALYISTVENRVQNAEYWDQKFNEAMRAIKARNDAVKSAESNYAHVWSRF